jgi:hypothetical protein
MKVITSQLKQIDISYDEWYNQLLISDFQLNLPPDEIERSALLYKICMKIFNDEIDVFDFFHRFDITLNFNQEISYFNTNMLMPLVDSIGYKIDDISYTINEEYQGTPIIPFAVFNVFVDNSVTTVGNNNEFNAEAAIGRGATLEKK